jgi:hypothetical protein
VNLTGPTNATITNAAGTGTIQNDDALGGFFSFSPGTYSVNEAAGLVTVTVVRTNDVTQAATVDYATDDTGASTNCSALNSGLSSQRCDYTSVFGTLKFAANETQKTIDIPINLTLIRKDRRISRSSCLTRRRGSHDKSFQRHGDHQRFRVTNTERDR